MSIKHLTPTSEQDLGFIIQPYSIQGLYYNYKRMGDAEIRENFKKIKLVRQEFSNGKPIYYEFSKAAINKMMKNPRGTSLTFDAATTVKKKVKDLQPWKQITYLVKSSSRFFLKPDIGEIFDQIFWEDWYDGLAAIAFESDHKLLEDTEGEHFLMTAILLKKK